MAGKGKKTGAPPSATTTPVGNEQGQGAENAPANVLSAGTASEAPPLNSQPEGILAFREYDCDDVASLFDIQPSDVLSWREYDNSIVVVTTSGHKLEAAK